MKKIKIFFLLLFTSLCTLVIAQDVPPDNIVTALKGDDATMLDKLITKENVNNCYGNYSLLSHAVRYNARKCFDLLIDKGADVNKVCNDYIPPIMHAAKYGRLDLLKILVSKGADIHFKYEGDYDPANGETPLTYAEKYNQTAIADYLRTLK